MVRIRTGIHPAGLCGYYDRSHLIRDFRKFSAKTRKQHSAVPKLFPEMTIRRTGKSVGIAHFSTRAAGQIGSMGRFATAAFPSVLERERNAFHRFLCCSLLKGGKAEDKAGSGWPQGILRKSRNLHTEGFEPVRAFSIILGRIQKAC